MASVTNTRGPHERARPVPAAFAAGADRGTAFRRARRHSVLVRVLRIVLPVTAVAMLCSYGIFVQRSIKVDGGTVTAGPVALSTENLTMQNPRYEGFNKDGSRYFVGARSAVQDLKQQAPIRLDGIQGRLVQANDAVTTLKATRGTFDSKANQLELIDGIDITSADGMTARLSRATVFVKENRVVSREPVTLQLAAGQVRGNEMVILQKTREAMFGNGVTARLTPKPKAGSTQVPQGRSGLIGAGNAPVEVSAATLKINDTSKIAVFSGNVRAQQGDATLTTRELEISYEGSPAPGRAEGESGGAGRVKRLLARSDVVLTRGGDRVTSDQAEFDVTADTASLAGQVVMTSGAERRASSDRVALDAKADTALLTGNVVVTQGKNVLKGRRLFLDRKAGITQLSAPAEGGMAQGRISARFYQNSADGRAKAPTKGASASTGGAAGWTFRTDPNAPIDVHADTLDVNDTTKTAVFRGDVQTVQGDFTVRTVELIASYAGQAGLSLGDGHADASKPKSAAQLQRIQARKKVVITSKDDQNASGDWAEFDVKSNTVILGGDVVLTQGRNVVRGPKLVIDMTTGQSRMETSRPAAAQAAPAAAPAEFAVQGREGGRQPAASPPPNTARAGPGGACGGRMCAVFYPKDAKEALKRGVGAIAKGAGGQTQEQREAPGRSTESPPAGATSSWSPDATQGTANE
jgi:LPS export ABC transporter protein LptC/lipopolysaccharide transport protein LptA